MLLVYSLTLELENDRPLFSGKYNLLFGSNTTFPSTAFKVKFLDGGINSRSPSQTTVL